MVTTISQAGNCINDPGVPNKCTHRGKKKKNTLGLNHTVGSLSARSMCRSWGHRGPRVPPWQRHLFPERALLVDIPLIASLNVKLMPGTIWSDNIAMVHHMQWKAGWEEGEQWDVLAVQGLYKLVPRSLWNHPVSKEPHNCWFTCSCDKCTERNAEDAQPVWAQISLSEGDTLELWPEEECSWIKNGWASWGEGIAQHVPRCWDTKELAGLENWKMAHSASAQWSGEGSTGSA